jgi:hypothetical protein
MMAPLTRARAKRMGSEATMTAETAKKTRAKVKECILKVVCAAINTRINIINKKEKRSSELSMSEKSLSFK